MIYLISQIKRRDLLRRADPESPMSQEGKKLPFIWILKGAFCLQI